MVALQRWLEVVKMAPLSWVAWGLLFNSFTEVRPALCRALQKNARLSLPSFGSSFRFLTGSKGVSKIKIKSKC